MASLEQIRAARATLAALALPGDQDLCQVITAHRPVDAVARLAYHIRARPRPHGVLPDVTCEPIRAYAARVVDDAARIGARVVIPEDDEWPTHLPDLDRSPRGQAAGAALCLWIRGTPPAREALHRCVAVVGARAATQYGSHIAEQIGNGLATAGWTVITTGAYGIDTAALQGALAGHGTATAVLPAGVDRPYPSGNTDLFDRIAARGLLISAWPPRTAPSRNRFTTTARLLAALACGTVLVEATMRSGALAVLNQAIALGRPAMIVPGPVTSTLSAGAHQALRQHREARLVQDTADILADLTS